MSALFNILFNQKPEKCNSSMWFWIYLRYVILFHSSQPSPISQLLSWKTKIPWSTFGFFSPRLPSTQYPSSCTWPWLSLDDEFWLTAASIGQERLPKHTGLKWSSFRTVSQFYPSEWHPCVSVQVCVCMCVNVSWACLVVCVATSPSARVKGV